MFSKKDEQEIQEGKAAIPKIKAAIHEYCSRIGEIGQGLLAFIVRDIDNIPSLSDVVRAYPTIAENRELAYNVMELYNIFDFESDIIPQSVYENGYMCLALKTITFPEALSEVRASLLDTTSVSEISTSTLDTTMGTNDSVLHGSSDYCEL